MNVRFTKRTRVYPLITHFPCENDTPPGPGLFNPALPVRIDRVLAVVKVKDLPVNLLVEVGSVELPG